MTHRLSFSNSWRYHPSVHRDGTASTWNLFLMPLLLLLLLLLLEMAGTCYIITEGGKTHTFQQYLSTDRKHSNHFKLGDLSGLPEASQNSQTGSWSGSRAVRQPASRTGSHTSVLCAGLWSATVTTSVPASKKTCATASVRKGRKNIPVIPL